MSVEAVITAFFAVIVIASILSLRARLPYTLVLVFMGIVLTAVSAYSVIGGNFIIFYQQLIGNSQNSRLFVASWYLRSSSRR